MGKDDLIRLGDVEVLLRYDSLGRKREAVLGILRSVRPVIPAHDEYVHLTYDGAPDAGTGRFAATLRYTLRSYRGLVGATAEATGRTRVECLRALADAVEDVGE